MTFDWQNALALGLVSAAAAYLARCVRRTWARPKAGSCGCARCPSGAANGQSSEPALVTVEALRSTATPRKD